MRVWPPFAAGATADWWPGAPGPAAAARWGPSTAPGRCPPVEPRILGNEGPARYPARRDLPRPATFFARPRWVRTNLVARWLRRGEVSMAITDSGRPDPGRSEGDGRGPAVLLEVWRPAPRFDNARGSAVAWVMTIAHRRAVDRVRSETASTARERKVAPGPVAGDDEAEMVETA